VSRLLDALGHDWRALAAEHGTPLLVLDCDRLRLQYDKLCQALPGVTQHYAIKALPNADAVRTLAERGAAFDLATNGEVELVERLRIDPRRTIHTHPIKRDDDIRRALRYGCTTFVADNVDELDKLVPYRHRVAVLLRIAFRNATSRVDLSRKFGCDVDHLAELLAAADGRGLHVKGLSFHVGSQAADGTAHASAIRRCAGFFEAPRAGAVAPLAILDIGGGFPANYDGTTEDIDAFCAPIRAALAELPARVRVIAEPGRYLAAPAMTCITAVVGRARRDGVPWYYLDDGVYGSFSGQIYDATRYPLIALARDPDRDPHARGAGTAVLAGPTCDSIDVVDEAADVGELEIGDLIVAPMIGAYSAASASTFNSLPRTPILALGAPARGEREPELRVV
jgi:ornithine decarboxylase